MIIRLIPRIVLDVMMGKVKSISVAICFLLLTANAFATAQYPDKIVFNGQTQMLHSNPMEAYFNKFPDKIPKTDVSFSALTRGYVATFEFDDSTLVLRDIVAISYRHDEEDSSGIGWKSFISEIQVGSEPLKVDWLTGLLVVPNGNVVDYVHSGFLSSYENYTIIQVAEGLFVQDKSFSLVEYEKFKQRQFEVFKASGEYKNIIEKFRLKGRMTDESIESWIRSTIIDYSTEILD